MHQATSNIIQVPGAECWGELQKARIISQNAKDFFESSLIEVRFLFWASEASEIKRGNARTSLSACSAAQPFLSLCSSSLWSEMLRKARVIRWLIVGQFLGRIENSEAEGFFPLLCLVKNIHDRKGREEWNVSQKHFVANHPRVRTLLVSGNYNMLIYLYSSIYREKPCY